VEELKRLEAIDHELAREIATEARRELSHRRELETSIVRRRTDIVAALSGLAGTIVVGLSVAAALSGLQGAKLEPVAVLAPLVLSLVGVLGTWVARDRPTKRKPPAPPGLRAAMATIGVDREALRRFSPLGDQETRERSG